MFVSHDMSVQMDSSNKGKRDARYPLLTSLAAWLRLTGAHVLAILAHEEPEGWTPATAPYLCCIRAQNIVRNDDLMPAGLVARVHTAIKAGLRDPDAVVSHVRELTSADSALADADRVDPSKLTETLQDRQSIVVREEDGTLVLLVWLDDASQAQAWERASSASDDVVVDYDGNDGEGGVIPDSMPQTEQQHFDRAMNCHVDMVPRCESAHWLAQQSCGSAWSLVGQLAVAVAAGREMRTYARDLVLAKRGKAVSTGWRASIDAAIACVTGRASHDMESALELITGVAQHQRAHIVSLTQPLAKMALEEEAFYRLPALRCLSLLLHEGSAPDLLDSCSGPLVSQFAALLLVCHMGGEEYLTLARHVLPILVVLANHRAACLEMVDVDAGQIARALLHYARHVDPNVSRAAGRLVDCFSWKLGALVVGPLCIEAGLSPEAEFAVSDSHWWAKVERLVPQLRQFVERVAADMTALPQSVPNRPDLEQQRLGIVEAAESVRQRLHTQQRDCEAVQRELDALERDTNRLRTRVDAWIASWPVSPGTDTVPPIQALLDLQRYLRQLWHSNLLLSMELSSLISLLDFSNVGDGSYTITRRLLGAMYSKALTLEQCAAFLDGQWVERVWEIVFSSDADDDDSVGDDVVSRLHHSLSSSLLGGESISAMQPLHNTLSKLLPFAPAKGQDAACPPPPIDVDDDTDPIGDGSLSASNDEAYVSGDTLDVQALFPPEHDPKGPNFVYVWDSSECSNDDGGSTAQAPVVSPTHLIKVDDVVHGFAELEAVVMHQNLAPAAQAIEQEQQQIHQLIAPEPQVHDQNGDCASGKDGCDGNEEGSHVEEDAEGAAMDEQGDEGDEEAGNEASEYHPSKEESADSGEESGGNALESETTEVDDESSGESYSGGSEDDGGEHVGGVQGASAPCPQHEIVELSETTPDVRLFESLEADTLRKLWLAVMEADERFMSCTDEEVTQLCADDDWMRVLMDAGKGGVEIPSGRHPVAERTAKRFARELRECLLLRERMCRKLEQHLNSSSLCFKRPSLMQTRTAQLLGPRAHLSPSMWRIALGGQVNFACLGNFSSPGTGKTGAALLAFLHSGLPTCLIVCPNAVVRQWAVQAKLLLPNGVVCAAMKRPSGDDFGVKCMPAPNEATLQRYVKDARSNMSRFVFVVNYDKFVNEKGNEIVMALSTSARVDMVVLDEAHMIKNPGAARSKLLRKLIRQLKTGARMCGHPVRVLGLTGTPVVNEPAEACHLVAALHGSEDIPALDDVGGTGSGGNASALLCHRAFRMLLQLPGLRLRRYWPADVFEVHIACPAPVNQSMVDALSAAEPGVSPMEPLIATPEMEAERAKCEPWKDWLQRTVSASSVPVVSSAPDTELGHNNDTKSVRIWCDESNEWPLLVRSYVQHMGSEFTDLMLQVHLTRVRARYIADIVHAELLRLKQLKSKEGKVLVYTHMVKRSKERENELVNILRTAIAQRCDWQSNEAKLRIATYVGSTSVQRQMDWSHPNTQVIVASAPIGVGVDGLQQWCNTLVFNVLPWTAAMFEQIKARLARRGQGQRVRVFVPMVNFLCQIIPDQDDNSGSDASAAVGEEGEVQRMCTLTPLRADALMWQRICFKRTMADGAVDGVLAESVASAASEFRQHNGAIQALLLACSAQNKIGHGQGECEDPEGDTNVGDKRGGQTRQRPGQQPSATKKKKKSDSEHMNG